MTAAATVVICTRNRAAMLERALRALLVQDHDGIDVLVVDNGSVDATREVASAAGVRIVDAPVPGLCRARNVGWRAAETDIVAYLDDDAVAGATYLRALARHAHERTDFVAGAADLLWEVSRPEWLPSGLDWALAATDFGTAARPLVPFAENPVGVNFVLRRRLAEDLGGFNEDLRYYADEVEFFWRAWDSGHTGSYDPELRVQHVVSGGRMTKRALLRKAYLMGQGVNQAQGREGRRHRGARSAARCLPLAAGGLVTGRFDRLFQASTELGRASAIFSG